MLLGKVQIGAGAQAQQYHCCLARPAASLCPSFPTCTLATMKSFLTVLPGGVNKMKRLQSRRELG